MCEQIRLGGRGKLVGFFDLMHEDILSAIARMSNLKTVDAHGRNGFVRIIANCQHLAWLQNFDNRM